MPKSNIFSLALIVILLAANATADLIPTFPSRRPLLSSHPLRSWIEVQVDKLPPGTELLYLNQRGKLRGVAKENQSLRVPAPGALYIAPSGKVAAPLSFVVRRDKLHLLREFTDSEIPASFAATPPPVILKCSATQSAGSDYSLNCSNLAGNRSAETGMAPAKRPKTKWWAGGL